MSLSKRTYVANDTVITAENLNAIQDEIITNCVTADQVKAFGETPRSNARTAIQASDYFTSHNYATCSTEAATAAKTVSITGFTSTMLVAGATVRVKFTNTNTASSPTLAVSGTDAKPITRYGTTAAGTTINTSWNAGEVVTLTYDGTSWVMAGYGLKGTIPVGNGGTGATTAANARTNLGLGNVSTLTYTVVSTF